MENLQSHWIPQQQQQQQDWSPVLYDLRRSVSNLVLYALESMPLPWIFPPNASTPAATAAAAAAPFLPPLPPPPSLLPPPPPPPPPPTPSSLPSSSGTLSWPQSDQEEGRGEIDPREVSLDEDGIFLRDMMLPDSPLKKTKKTNPLARLAAAADAQAVAAAEAAAENSKKRAPPKKRRAPTQPVADDEGGEFKTPLPPLPDRNKKSRGEGSCSPFFRPISLPPSAPTAAPASSRKNTKKAKASSGAAGAAFEALVQQTIM